MIRLNYLVTGYYSELNRVQENGFCEISDKDISEILNFSSVNSFLAYFKKHPFRTKKVIKQKLADKVYELEVDYFKTFVFPVTARFYETDPEISIKHLRVKYID